MEYLTNEEINEFFDKIKDDIIEKSFSITNPKNTREFIRALDIDTIENIIDTYSKLLINKII